MSVCASPPPLDMSIPCKIMMDPLPASEDGTPPVDAEDGQFEELRSLALKVLESRGVLAEVRAHLRACIFEAIDQNSAQRGEAAPHKAQRGPHTSLGEELVAEFLEFHGLQHSLTVFATEAQLAELPGAQGRRRMEVAADVGIPSSPDFATFSLLEQLLQNSQTGTLTHENLAAQDAGEKRHHRHKSKSSSKGTKESSKRLSLDPRFFGHEGPPDSNWRLDGSASLGSRDLDAFPVRVPPHHHTHASHLGQSPRIQHEPDPFSIHDPLAHSHSYSSASHGREPEATSARSYHGTGGGFQEPASPMTDGPGTWPGQALGTAKPLKVASAPTLDRGAAPLGSRGAAGDGAPAQMSRNRLPPLSACESSGSGSFLPGVRQHTRQQSCPVSPKSMTSSTAHVAFAVPSRGPSSPALSPTSSAAALAAAAAPGQHTSQPHGDARIQGAAMPFTTAAHEAGSPRSGRSAFGRITSADDNLDVTLLAPPPGPSPPMSPKSFGSRSHALSTVGFETDGDGARSLAISAASEGSAHNGQQQHASAPQRQQSEPPPSCQAAANSLSTLSAVHGPLPRLTSYATAPAPGIGCHTLDTLDFSGSDASASRTAQDKSLIQGSPLMSPKLKDAVKKAQDWQESSDFDASTRVPTPAHTSAAGASSSAQPSWHLGLSKSMSHEEVSASTPVEESWQSETQIAPIGQHV
mmetsp:Transcript_64486/g.153964  ORF Transcript_64486/g.153964 Transcript_64486/m.153964 type:complete len:693 (+) Transcript_64486:111-2189(+)